MRHPEPLHDPTWNYVVLGAEALFEGASFATSNPASRLRGCAGPGPTRPRRRLSRR